MKCLEMTISKPLKMVYINWLHCAQWKQIETMFWMVFILNIFLSLSVFFSSFLFHFISDPLITCKGHWFLYSFLFNFKMNSLFIIIYYECMNGEHTQMIFPYFRLMIVYRWAIERLKFSSLHASICIRRFGGEQRKGMNLQLNGIRYNRQHTYIVHTWTTTNQITSQTDKRKDREREMELKNKNDSNDFM